MSEKFSYCFLLFQIAIFNLWRSCGEYFTKIVLYVGIYANAIQNSSISPNHVDRCEFECVSYLHPSFDNWQQIPDLKLSLTKTFEDGGKVNKIMLI